MPMKVMKTMVKRRVPDCRNFKQCGRKAKSVQATLCHSCFLEQAVSRGAQSSGNAKGNAGHAGNAKGNPGNAGNADAKGSVGNAGNKGAGVAKKPAGMNSSGMMYPGPSYLSPAA